MTDRATRVTVLVVAVLVFVLTWAVVAARPWVTAKPDPRLAALAQREQALRADAKLVGQIVAARAAVSRATANAAGNRSLTSASTAAPVVRVVNLPPLTITRTS
jgi:hypothetical protein